MSNDKLILVSELCKYYRMEQSFFNDMHELGLIEILSLNDKHFIDENKISIVDKVIRMHNDLNLNIEAIDTLFNLLEKINALQTELILVQNRLRLYEPK